MRPNRQTNHTGVVRDVPENAEIAHSSTRQPAGQLRQELICLKIKIPTAEEITTDHSISHIQDTHITSPHSTYLSGVRGVGDVVGAHVAAEHRVKDLVGQALALGGVAQQVAGHLQ
jgi:hypothetical protein